MSVVLRSSYLFLFFHFLSSFLFLFSSFLFRFLIFFLLLFCFSFFVSFPGTAAPLFLNAVSFYVFPRYRCPSLPSCGRGGEKVNNAKKCTMSERSEEERKNLFDTKSNVRCSDREPSRRTHPTAAASATRIRELLSRASQRKMKPSPSCRGKTRQRRTIRHTRYVQL